MCVRSCAWVARVSVHLCASACICKSECVYLWASACVCACLRLQVCVRACVVGVHASARPCVSGSLSACMYAFFYRCATMSGYRLIGENKKKSLITPKTTYPNLSIGFLTLIILICRYMCRNARTDAICHGITQHWHRERLKLLKVEKRNPGLSLVWKNFWRILLKKPQSHIIQPKMTSQSTKNHQCCPATTLSEGTFRVNPA